LRGHGLLFIPAIWEMIDGTPGKGVVAQSGREDITADECGNGAWDACNSRAGSWARNASSCCLFFAQRAADQLVDRRHGREAQHLG